MADASPRQTPRRGRRALRVLLVVGLFLSGLILFLSLTVGGLLLFIHTDTGRSWVTGKVNDALAHSLAASGLTARIDALTGSLPSQLGFQGLSVADADGLWLTVDQVQLNMGWSALRKHQLTVRSINVEHPVLMRLPHLKEGPQTEPDQAFDLRALLAQAADWPDRLPPLAVEHVNIKGLSLGPDVAGESITLNLQGEASASPQKLHAALSLRRDDKPGAEQADARVSLQANQVLTLSLALAETSDGLLARAVPPGLAEAPALRLLFQGSAPLADWQGDIHLDLLETDTTERSETSSNDRVVLTLTGGLGFAPLESDPRLNWDLTASTGKASTGLWRMAKQKNGRAVARLTGRTVLKQSRVAPNDAEAPAENGVSAALNAQGHLNLNLDNMEWADPRLTALAGPHANLEADCALEWRAGASPDGEADPVSPCLEAALRNLTLTGQAVSVRGDALWHSANLDPLSPSSALDISLAAEVADTSGMALPGISAQGPLELHLRAHGAMSALNADLALTGEVLTLKEENLKKPHIHLSLADLNISDLTAGTVGQAPVGPTVSGTVAAGRGLVEASVRVRDRDVSLNSHWEMTQGRDVLTAAVRGLSIRADGLRVDGDISAVLPTPRPSASSGGQADTVPASVALPALTGSLRAEVSDWNVLSSLSGVPLSGGNASLAVRFAPEADSQGATAVLDVDSLRIDTPNGSERLSITKLRGTARAEDVFRAPRGNVDIAGGEIQAGGVDMRAVRLTAGGPLSGPLAVSAHSEGDVEADVDVAWKPGEATVRALRVRLSKNLVRAAQPASESSVAEGACPPSRQGEKAPEAAGPWGVRLLKPALIRYGADGFSTPGLDLALEPSGIVRLSGALNAQSLKLNGSVDNLKIDLFRPLFPALPKGTVQAQATLTGTPSRPGGELVVHLNEVQAPGSSVPPVSCTVKSILKHAAGGGGMLDSSLSFPPDTLRTLGATRAEATLNLPLSFAADGLPRPRPQGTLRGEAVWEGDLAPLWNFTPLADRRLTGRGSLRLNAAGSLDHPELTGQVHIKQAAYEDLNLGLLLTGIDAEVNLDKADRPGAAGPVNSLGRARLSLKAGDGMGGSLSLNGSLDPAALTVDVRGGMDNLTPLRRQDLRVNLSGEATVTGAVAAPDVKAAIIVNQGELALNDLPGGSITVLPISDAREKESAASLPSAPAGTLDVEVTVPSRFFVRGHGLTSDWKGQVHVRGPLNAPSVEGNLSAARGTLDLLNRTFALTRGVITFDGGQTINPRLDIIMTYTAANFLADVNIGGTASRPQVNLSSKPAMPQDEIIAQVMFGRPAGKLGRLETLQLAGAAAALAGFGNGGGGVFDLARKSLGVDVLRLGSSENGDGGLGGSTLEVGKYISDKVYVGFSQGFDADSTGAVVDVDLTRHITLEARTGSTRSEVGVEWSYDY